MENSGSRLVVVCGLPGSGKTTYAKQLESKFQALRFCPDEWMRALSLDLWDEARRLQIEKLQWEFAQQLLTYRQVVIIEWGTSTRSERDTLRIRARELGASVELHYITASIDVLFDRIERRGMENPPISRKQFLDWVDVFQEPTADETALFDNAVTMESSKWSSNAQTEADVQVDHEIRPISNNYYACQAFFSAGRSCAHSAGVHARHRSKAANNLPYDSKARRLIFSGGAQSDPTISPVKRRP